MEKVAKLTEKERSELFSLTAAKKGVIPALIEKDFWVCLVLKSIFEDPELKEYILFKGGTSLSKVYGLINRFSEDIDLILDWRTLGISDDSAWSERSINQQNKFNDRTNNLGREFIAQTIVPILERILAKKTNSKTQISIDPADGLIVMVHYPLSFTHPYLLGHVKLEIGPLALRVPYVDAQISSYAAQEYPQLFNISLFNVKVITAERSFWEKATILHQIASVDESKPVTPRYSRHYYDVFQLANSPIKVSALKDLKLLQEVVEFKARFYRSPAAHYELAKPPTFRILPSKEKLKVIEEDYRNMQEMIFGAIPEFAEIVSVLTSLEREINTA
jgi:hypothetical protein